MIACRVCGAMFSPPAHRGKPTTLCAQHFRYQKFRYQKPTRPCAKCGALTWTGTCRRCSRTRRDNRPCNVCLACGKEFSRRRTVRDAHKYCSQACDQNMRWGVPGTVTRESRDRRRRRLRRLIVKLTQCACCLTAFSSRSSRPRRFCMRCDKRRIESARQKSRDDYYAKRRRMVRPSTGRCVICDAVIPDKYRRLFCSKRCRARSTRTKAGRGNLQKLKRFFLKRGLHEEAEAIAALQDVYKTLRGKEWEQWKTHQSALRSSMSTAASPLAAS